MTTVEVFAPAKINLTLHITGLRADGYHLLDSLVAFADVGDRLSVMRADQPSFSVTGPFAQGVPTGPENLVSRALALAAPDQSFAVTLEKNLPPASGIGGGSADAAAALRAAQALGVAAPPAPERVAAIGADVPMCLTCRPARVTGIGETLQALPDMPALAAVLVNPGIGVATAQVFQALAGKSNPGLTGTPPQTPANLIDWLGGQRNDLEPPAQTVAPVISEVLTALRSARGVDLARMSGSGATCFGLCADDQSAITVAQALATAHPDWWVVATRLGDQSARVIPQ